MVLQRLIPDPVSLVRGIINGKLAKPGRETNIVSGLVPIGDTGLYRNANTPTDPTNCARYPDSLFCGGNPLSILPLGYEPNIVFDSCNVGIRVTPVVGFVRLPPIALIYRKPECRFKPYTKVDESPELTCYLVDCLGGDVTIGYSGTEWIPGNINDLEGYDSATVSDLEYNFDNFGRKQLYTIKKRITILNYQGLQTCFLSVRSGNSWITGMTNPDNPTTTMKGGVPDSDYHPGTGYITRPMYTISHSGDQENVDAYFLARYMFDDFKIDYINCSLNQPPPPPIFKEEEDEMGCCDLVELLIKKVNALDKKIGSFPQSINIYDEKEAEVGAQAKIIDIQNVAEGIKLTTQRIEVASKIIGIEEYPITVPENLVTETEVENGELKEKEVKTKELSNHTQLITWFFERFDEVFGQWEIPIAIQDGIADENDNAEQTQYLKFKNLSEFLAELMGLVLNLSINSEANINVSTRAMIEAGEARQEAIKAYLYAKANSEYLAYGKQEYPFPLFLSFTPGAMSLDKVLQVNEVKVKGIKFFDSHTFQDHLIKLLEAAAITTAVNRVSYNRKGSPEQQIMSYLRDKLLMADILTGKKNPNGSEKETEDFDVWADQAERGFADVPGVVNTTEPYGKPFEERPRIRKLGDTSKENQ